MNVQPVTRSAVDRAGTGAPSPANLYMHVGGLPLRQIGSDHEKTPGPAFPHGNNTTTCTETGKECPMFARLILETFCYTREEASVPRRR